jgi:hypothetical protein
VGHRCKQPYIVVEPGVKSKSFLLQVHSAGGQKAVQQEVEMLQTQNGAAAGHAAPKTEQAQLHTHIGRDLPPTKVLCCYIPLLIARSLTTLGVSRKILNGVGRLSELAVPMF